MVSLLSSIDFAKLTFYAPKLAGSKGMCRATRIFWCGKPNGVFRTWLVKDDSLHLLDFQIVQRTFDFLHSAFGHMRIPFGRLNASVSKQFQNVPHIGFIFQQMSCKRMTERMKHPRKQKHLRLTRARVKPQVSWCYDIEFGLPRTSSFLPRLNAPDQRTFPGTRQSYTRKYIASS